MSTIRYFIPVSANCCKTMIIHKTRVGFLLLDKKNVTICIYIHTSCLSIVITKNILICIPCTMKSYNKANKATFPYSEQCINNKAQQTFTTYYVTRLPHHCRHNFLESESGMPIIKLGCAYKWNPPKKNTHKKPTTEACLWASTMFC